MSCLCVDMIAHACAVQVTLKNIYSVKPNPFLSVQSFRAPALATTPDSDHPPFPGRGQLIVPFKATAGVGHPE